MVHQYRLTSAKLVCVISALLLTMSAHASLSNCGALALDSAVQLDCVETAAATVNTASVPVLSELKPGAPAHKSSHSEYQVDQSRHASAIPGTVPVLVLISALLVILLIRAKRFNTK